MTQIALPGLEEYQIITEETELGWVGKVMLDGRLVEEGDWAHTKQSYARSEAKFILDKILED